MEKKLMFFNNNMSGWRLVTARKRSDGLVCLYFERPNNPLYSWVTLYVTPEGEVY